MGKTKDAVSVEQKHQDCFLSQILQVAVPSLFLPPYKSLPRLARLTESPVSTHMPFPTPVLLNAPELPA
jgi:hypothetical protein